MKSKIEWVKITTDMFDNRKIKYLRKLPEGNSIVLIWIMLLTMAGRCRANGMIFLTENIPYTTKSLADELGFDENTVKFALAAFESLNMVRTNPEDFLQISGWEEYQKDDEIERIREQTRKRVANHRTRGRQLVMQEHSICAYCGKEADTIDHIIPRNKNGSDDENNLVPCCKSCNSSKKDKDLADFLNDSFYYKHEGVDHELVRSNQKLMSYVVWDPISERYSTADVTKCNGVVTLCNGNVTPERNAEKERTKEKDYIYISSNNEKDLSLNPSQVSNDIDTQVTIPGNSLVRDNQVTLTPTPSEKPSVNYTDADTVIDYMNSVSGKKYRHIKSNRDRVLARLGEGYSVEDCKTVVKKMWDAWKNTEMEQYFRPETLFRPTKFEGYLNRSVEKGKPRIDPSEYETGKDFGW